MIKDFISGRMIPNVGAEGHRQAVERYLVEEKGYARTDIEVDVPISFEVAGETYRSVVDLVVSPDNGNTRLIAVKCAAASLGSREREILAAARLLEEYQIPYCLVSDGRRVIFLETVTGRKLGGSWEAVPDKNKAMQMAARLERRPLPEKQREKTKLIFRSYDSENVNVARNI
jgi:hypothetical protein